jgi:hypothetical protein
LNYKYLKIYHEIIKQIIWLGRKIEVDMVLDFMWKNMIKKYLIKSYVGLLWMKIGVGKCFIS